MFYFIEILNKKGKKTLKGLNLLWKYTTQCESDKL
jgi:hypothetical protein